MGHPILFIALASVAICASLGMLLSKNAVHSALYLVLNFVTIAVFYIVLNAPFIAMVQITVYAGAIMVLFLFVIMLLGAEQLPGVSNRGRPLQGIFSLILAIILIVSFFSSLVLKGQTEGALPAFEDASPEAIGLVLFENFVFPFEITSILLLVAMMSLVVWRTQKRKS